MGQECYGAGPVSPRHSSEHGCVPPVKETGDGESESGHRRKTRVQGPVEQQQAFDKSRKSSGS